MHTRKGDVDEGGAIRYVQYNIIIIKSTNTSLLYFEQSVMDNIRYRNRICNRQSLRYRNEKPL